MQETGTKYEKKPVRIVICDDDKTVQEIIQNKIGIFCAVAGTACQTICCDSGEKVLHLGQAPDILFLDIRMPGRNGMEIAEELRKYHRDMILIFMTALSEYVYEAFDVGAFHYLVKPFGEDKLKEVLGKALRQYERQQEIARLRRAGYDRIGTDKINGAILVKKGGVSTKVLLEDIIYAEVFNRKVMLHTMGGDIEYYGKLTDFGLGKAVSEKAKDSLAVRRSICGGHGNIDKYSD